VKTNVYIVKCASYDKAGEKIEELISLMGGMGQFAKPGEKITLKPNLLFAASPEQAVTTHPSIVAAIGAMAKKEGAIPIIADSPGSGYRYNKATLKKLYQASGMNDAAELAGIALNMDTGHDRVAFPQGKEMKNIDVIKPVSQADAVFNLCKMKTHMLMHMTGAVKNNFGIIPGLTKIGFHAKQFTKARFADMLLDLTLYVSPRLSIMDAVVAMEGEGPGASGTPRQVGLLLASASPLALDVVAGEIMGLPREQNPVVIAAEKRGLTPCGIDEIHIVGEELSSLRISDYQFTSTVKIIRPVAGNTAVAGAEIHPAPEQYPVMLNEKCAGCGVCVNACPQKAIALSAEQEKQIAVIDIKNCIRCYCCHELCPHEAIMIQ